MSENLQIKDILSLPTEDLEKLLAEDWEKLLGHLVPLVRTPNKAHVEDENQKMIERLSKIFNV